MSVSTLGVPLAARIALFVGVVGAAGIGGLAAWESQRAQVDVVDAEARRVTALAAELHRGFEVADHERLAAMYDEPDALWSWYGHGTWLREQHEALVRFGEVGELTRVRTLRPADAAAEAVRSGPHDRRKGALQEIVAATAEPRWRAPADYVPEMRDAWTAGRPAWRLVESETRGARVQTWLPLVDRHGQTTAVLELESEVTAALAAARTDARRPVGAAVVAWVVLLGGGLLLARPADRERDRALAELRRVVASGGEAKVRHGGDPLLRELEALRVALSGRVVEVETRAVGTEAQARSVGALHDDRAAARRKALAALVPEGALVVDAGESRRELANLVDLSVAHLVLQVPRYTAVDLAPGMVARVGWIAGGEEVDLTVSLRTETEDGWEYVFALSQGAGLPATPPDVAALAFARGAERVSLEAAEVSAELVVSAGGALPVRVTDLSADGAGLVVPVGPGALAASGTQATLVLRLVASEPELQFGVILRSVGGCDEGSRVGIQFDAPMTTDYENRRARVAKWVQDRRRVRTSAAA